MNTSNRDKILYISKRLGLSHIGSCLSVLPILEEIYRIKKPQDKVVLSNAHAHLAHLITRTPYYSDETIEDLIKKDIHCNRGAGCDASGGSLGHGLGISIGYALAGYNVHCIVSDGSMMEGSEWEALRIIGGLGFPIKIYTNFNGYTAVSHADFYTLKTRMSQFVKGIEFRQTDNTEGFRGVQGHYQILE